MPNQGLSLGVDLPGQTIPGEAKKAALYQALLNMGAMMLQRTPYKQNPLASIVQGLAGGAGTYNNMLGGYQQQLLQDQLRQMKVRELESQIGLQGAQKEYNLAHAEKMRRPDLDEALKRDLLEERIAEKKRQAVEAQKASDASSIQSVLAGLTDEDVQKLGSSVPYLEGLMAEHPPTYESYTRSMKRQAPKVSMATIYGPKGATKKVPVIEGQEYAPPSGWSLNEPPKPEKAEKPTDFDKKFNAAKAAAKRSVQGREPTEEEIANKYKKMWGHEDLIQALLSGSMGGGGTSTGEFYWDPESKRMVKK